MIKIKLFEPHIHRNETSYRPLWFIKNELKHVGIELTLNDNSYDFMIVGQASIIDKKKSLHESVEMGLKKLDSITGDYIILDGQDAPTLIGTGDVFRHVYTNNNCKLFLKTSYYKDFDLYKKNWMLGRMYWGEGDYSVPDIDDMKPKMKLAGFNWLSTLQLHFDDKYKNVPKDYDISAMFQYPMGKQVYEHGMLQSAYYDNFRKGLYDQLDDLEKLYEIARLKDGIRVEQNEYYQNMLISRLIIAPFGYGEIAPRDIESAIMYSILLKNDMSHIETIPNIYVPEETYIPIKWDWSDLDIQIIRVLSEYDELREKFVTNLREKYIKENDPMKRVQHFYNLIKDIDTVGGVE